MKHTKRVLSIFMAAIMLLSAGAAGISAFAAQEQPALVKNVTRLAEPPEGYTAITTAAQLNAVRNNLSGKYILMNDIDLAAFGNWSPIGTAQAPFTGIFNGNGYAVKNMKIRANTSENIVAGMFGCAECAELKNIIVKNADLLISNANSIYAGMLCGMLYGTRINGCTISGKMNINAKAEVYAGGIAGCAYNQVDSTTYEIQALCEIVNCINNSEIIAKGVCSEPTNSISFCSGGIVGDTNAELSCCANNGSIVSLGDRGENEYVYTLAGGISGNSSGEITNCYNAGAISSTGTKYAFSGGISGHWFQFDNIINCYNVGKIDSEIKNAVDNYIFAASGGVIGEIEPIFVVDSFLKSNSDTPIVRNCYYLDTAEKAFGDAMPDNSENVKCLNAGEVKKQTSFNGFDFASKWKMSKNLFRPILMFEEDVEIVNIITKTGKAVKSDLIIGDSIKEWYSSDESVARLNSKGYIKGVSSGTAEIIITMNDGHTIQCNVIVEFSALWWLFNLLFGWIRK